MTRTGPSRATRRALDSEDAPSRTRSFEAVRKSVRRFRALCTVRSRIGSPRSRSSRMRR